FNCRDNVCGCEESTGSSRGGDFRRAGVDPLFYQSDLIRRRPRFLVRRRYRIVTANEASKELRLGGIAWDDLLAIDEPLAIEDEIEPPFVGPVVAVTAVAIGLEDCLNLLGKRRVLRLGRLDSRNE